MYHVQMADLLYNFSIYYLGCKVRKTRYIESFQDVLHEWKFLQKILMVIL